MASTLNFDIPLIDPAAPFDGANDINKMANKIDESLETVKVLGQDATFVLEPATPIKLGGVRIGNGVSVAPDGTISTKVEPYVLPPASQTTLGGVKVPEGSGFELDADGTLSIVDASVKLPAGSVGTDQLADGAVTTAKIAANTVTRENMAPAIQTLLDESENYVSGRMQAVAGVSYTGGVGTSDTAKVSAWGGCVGLRLRALNVQGNGSASSFKVCEFPTSAVPGDIMMGSTFVQLVSGSTTVGAKLTLSKSLDTYAVTLSTNAALPNQSYTCDADTCFIVG